MISELNDRQQEALLHTSGATLVIAGAGSGKTKVLTHKIAYLIENEQMAPWNILAITFTNKAAKEMKERIEGLIGLYAHDVWIGTFHSICLRILRKHIDKLGYSSSFSIYDVSEQKTAIKQILKDLEIESKILTDKYIQGKISNFKNEMKNPEDIEIPPFDINLQTVVKIYEFYQKRLKENNAVDFDDIINLTIKLLREFPEVQEEYANKFRYVLVDEYQDTNKSQFELIRLFTDVHKNITVVGDNDQGIYSFRGADIQNILDFEKDFENVKVVKLEQNYRSTKNILNVANAVIKNNESKYDKKLWTNQEEGSQVEVKKLNDEYHEARYIAKAIIEAKKENYSFNDFAVLYRMNTLSRVIEDVLIQEGIPYRVVGGLKFLDRKEIKDVISYLKVIENPSDNIAFSRIINEPKRGIGTTTIDKISKISMETGLSMYEITKRSAEFGLNKLYAQSNEFIQMMEEYRERRNELPLTRIYEGILKDSGYIGVLQEKEATDDVAKNRIENLEEFYNVIVEFEKEEADTTLGAFLENFALATDKDSVSGEEENSNGEVTLMTLHASKGLEFPTVFLIGVEDGIFPSVKSLNSKEELEEERRLCYVGITRAREKLYITCSGKRTVYGKSTPSLVSRFIKEIPEELAKIDLETEQDRINAKRQTTWSFNEEPKTTTFQMTPERFLEQLKNKKKEQNTNTYIISQRVYHKKFGEGTINNIHPEGSDRILEILFDKVGMKRFMESSVKLEII